MSNQLIKNTALGTLRVYPKTYTEGITDKSTGKKLAEILSNFNMYFLSYTGNTAQTRCQVPKDLRREGLWITYVDFNHKVITEWYNSDNIDNETWGVDTYWRQGSNKLIGDISISINGNWVINGKETEFKATGDPIKPLLRVNFSTNKLQVSYDDGNKYENLGDNPVYTLFRTANNKLLVSTDLGKTWTDTSEYIAAWFRWASGDTADSVGKILISRDEQKTWTDLSPNIVNNLRIKGYVSAVGNLPSDATLGDIYMVGPTYDESDTTHDYPHYRMWVKLSSGWIDNGEYLSNVLMSLTTGLETGITMSLKAITDSIAAETARAKAAEEANAAAIEAEAEKLTELEREINGSAIVESVEFVPNYGGTISQNGISKSSTISNNQLMSIDITDRQYIKITATLANGINSSDSFKIMAFEDANGNLTFVPMVNPLAEEIETYDVDIPSSTVTIWLYNRKPIQPVVPNIIFTKDVSEGLITRVSKTETDIAKKIDEAPIDGKQYARKDGTWVRVSMLIDDNTNIEFKNKTYIDNNGIEQDGLTNWCSTDKISCSEGELFKVTLKGSVKGVVATIAFYIGDTFIAQSTASEINDLVITIPSGVTNVRFSTRVQSSTFTPLAERTKTTGTPILQKERNVLRAITKDTFVVGSGADVDFTNIHEALEKTYGLDTKEHPITILVKSGVYETPEVRTSLNWTQSRWLNIIGEGKHNTIIKNTNGYYFPGDGDNACLRVSGNIFISNITFISTDENYDDSTKTNKNRHSAYCIHVDNGVKEESTMEVFNCNLINNHAPCIGFGLRNNFTLFIHNCTLKSSIFSESNWNDKGATIYGHDGVGTATDDILQHLIIKDCYIENTNGNYALYCFNTKANNKTDALLIGNSCVVAEGGSGFAKQELTTLKKGSFGNNIASMNYL